MIYVFRKKMAIILILASAVSLTISGILTYALYQKAFNDNNDIIESYQTIRAINRILLSVNEAALNVSSFIITEDINFTKQLPKTITSIRVNLATLSQLIQGDATESEMNKKLNIMVNDKIIFLQSTMKLNALVNKKSLISDPNRLLLTYSINELAGKIKDIEIKQLEKAMPRYQLSINRANRIFILLGLVNVILILLSFAFTRPFLNTDK